MGGSLGSEATLSVDGNIGEGDCDHLGAVPTLSQHTDCHCSIFLRCLVDNVLQIKICNWKGSRNPIIVATLSLMQVWTTVHNTLQEPVM